MNRRVGYRFHPTDEELIDYFLRQKINGTLHCDDILQIDICKFEPWDLPKYAAQGLSDDEWYFFHKREPKNRNTSKPRYNRSTTTGHWKPTGKDRPVKAKRNRSEIGVKKTLVFYKYTESNKEVRTNWVIHEYEPKAFPYHQADLVLCKLKEKADDKAESFTCREAESSRQGPSDIDVFPAGLTSSELLLQTMIPDNGVNFDQPNTQQQQIEIYGGISIDDLGLSDDIFRSVSDGIRCPFGTTGQQLNPNEMDEHLLSALTASTFDYNLDEASLKAHTHLSHSSSSGIYLDDITDMDADNFCGMSSYFGDSNMDNGNSGPREYRQMQSVQSLTETLPAPKLELQTCFENLHLPSTYEKSSATKNLDRHGNINSTGKANNPAGKIIFQHKLLRPSDLKAREARKPGTDLNPPFKSPKEKIPLKTERESDQKMVAGYINTETSMLNQRSVPISVYIVNISIGLVLFVAAVRDLLIVH